MLFAEILECIEHITIVRYAYEMLRPIIKDIAHYAAPVFCCENSILLAALFVTFASMQMTPHSPHTLSNPLLFFCPYLSSPLLSSPFLSSLFSSSHLFSSPLLSPQSCHLLSSHLTPSLVPLPFPYLLFSFSFSCITGNDPDAYRPGGDIHDSLMASSPSSLIIDTFKDVSTTDAPRAYFIYCILTSFLLHTCCILNVLCTYVRHTTYVRDILHVSVCFYWSVSVCHLSLLNFNFVS